jgi:hypothetical protein
MQWRNNILFVKESYFLTWPVVIPGEGHEIEFLKFTTHPEFAVEKREDVIFSNILTVVEKRDDNI